MLEGIEILNQTEIIKTPLWCFILLIIGFVSVVVSIKILINTRKTYIRAISLVFVFLEIMLIFFLLNFTEPTGIYKYQVIIDRSVSVTDLYENYEIIKQEGKIWTIIDKNRE